jgi:hypothetical protein
MCPPTGVDLMPCCGRSPHEALNDRITVDPDLVTCVGPIRSYDQFLQRYMPKLWREMKEREVPDEERARMLGEAAARDALAKLRRTVPELHQPRLRRFELHREDDETGISGTGVVAHGVEFYDRTIAMRWITLHTSTALYASISDVEAIHGHNGKTQVVWLDE